jgi:hypothetical protein
MKSSRTKTLFWLTIIVLLVGFSANVQCQFPTSIITATKKADAKELSSYFSGKIELVLPEKSGVFGSPQARLILDDFFKHNPVSSFQIIHQGKRQDSAFAIGKYQSGSKIYRFYFLTKKKEDKTYIHQLRIEKEDD